MVGVHHVNTADCQSGGGGPESSCSGLMVAAQSVSDEQNGRKR